MLSPTPLLIVVGTVVLLAIIQWLMNRVENAQQRQVQEPATAPTTAPPSPQKAPPGKASPEMTTAVATPSPKAKPAPAAASKPAPAAKQPAAKQEPVAKQESEPKQTPAPKQESLFKQEPAPKPETAPKTETAPKSKAKLAPVAKQEPAPAAKAKPAGKPLLPGLTVKGLDKKGTEELKKLIIKGDKPSLASWLAVHRPGIVELDEFLASNRTRFKPFHANTFGANPQEKDSASLASFPLTNLPAGIRFDDLSEQERLLLLTFDPGSQRLINQELIAQFGGQMFTECFEFYCNHDKSIARSVSANDPDRNILETLANSSIADKGRHIPLALRLTVMSMDQLREMGKDLNRELKYTDKNDLAEQLAAIPGAAVLLSMQYKVDDLFILNPLKSEPENTLREWQFLKAYAELLISRELPAALSE